MSLSRRLLFLLPAAVCCCAPLQDCLAQQKAKGDPFVVQSQNYAVLDISSTSTQGISVEMVALDDSSHAAFAYGLPQNSGGQPTEYHVYTWTNGTPRAADVLMLDRTEIQGMLPWYPLQSVQFHYSPTNLLANGKVFGSARGYLDRYKLNTGHIFSAIGNLVDSHFVPSPYVIWEPDHYSQITSVASDGSFAGLGYFNGPPTYFGTNDSGPWTGGFITTSGRADFFDLLAGMMAPGFTGGGTTRVHTQEYFEPDAINTKGWAMGGEYGPGWTPTGSDRYEYGLGNQIWNADKQEFVDLGRYDLVYHTIDGSVVVDGFCINNDNDILVSGVLNPTTHRYEGAFLFKKGNTSSQNLFLPNSPGSTGLLPEKAQAHFRNLRPLLLSNRVDPPTDGSVKPVLYILFTAEIERDPGVWQSSTFLLDLLSNEKTTLQEVAYPEGVTNVQLKSINTSGVIAAIGDSNTGAKQALLLLPVDIKVSQPADASPTQSIPKYHDAPKAYVASNLFGLWPDEKATIKIKLPPPFDDQDNLPPKFITWSGSITSISDNTVEQIFSWSAGSANSDVVVLIKVGNANFPVHFTVVDVGSLSEVQMLFLLPNASSVMWFNHNEAAAFGNRYGIGTPRADAMRHSYWCALSSSTYDMRSSEIVSCARAHEYQNCFHDKQNAFSSAMDLHNNAFGAEIRIQKNGIPDRDAIKAVLERAYSEGTMYIWEIPVGAPSSSEQDSEGILIRSNFQRIFP